MPRRCGPGSVDNLAELHQLTQARAYPLVAAAGKRFDFVAGGAGERRAYHGQRTRLLRADVWLDSLGRRQTRIRAAHVRRRAVV